MLVLPMPPSLPNLRHPPGTLLPLQTPSQVEPSCRLDLQKQLTGSMLSVIPPPPQPRGQRPKLSLQTSLPPLSTPSLHQGLPTDTSSPTTRNTLANTFDAPPPAPSSAVQPRINISPSLAIPPQPKPRSALVAPYPYDTPYTLSLRSHSILRNSPLPKRHLSATSSTRAHKRIFFPIKRVAFNEKPADIIPPAVVESLEVEEQIDEQRSLEEREERRAAIQAEDGGMKASRGKDWIWRPMPGEDFLTEARDDSDAFEVGESTAVETQPVVQTTSHEQI